jgi:hypothetical protein
MVPIFEQGQGQGIGYNFNTFVKRFHEICNEKIKKGNDHSFAFILYDFENQAIKDILRTQGGFAQLERLISNNLSVFYLHTENQAIFKKFNYYFLSFFKLDENHKRPLVLFFKLINDNIQDIRVVELQQDNYLFAFNELYIIIEQSIKNESDRKLSFIENKFVKFTFYTFKILYTTTVEYFAGKGYDKI